MASSRQNSSQMLNSQSSSSTSTTSTNAKDKTVHTKSDAKNKHDKSSSSSSGHIPMSSNTIINSMNNMSKRKGTSFQITSVSVSSGNTQQQQQQQQRTGAENNGDDSADDLDESHTDDNISRITDYETPSYSEDSCSHGDVFYAQPNAFGTAPVIPTSSQYGLAIVGPDLGGNGANLTDVHVSVSDAGIINMGQIPNKQDVDHKNERFKVVKIESTEPFKRGRWMCMDYLDHTALQAQDDGIDGSPKEEGDENAGKTKDSGLESGFDGGDTVMDNGDLELNDNDGFDQEVMRAEMNHYGDGTSNLSHASHEHHTMTSIPIHNEHPIMMQSHAQSMPQGQIQQIISQDSIHTTTTISESVRVEHAPSDTLPTHASHNFGGQHPQVDQHSNSPMIQHHAHSMTPDMIQNSLQQEHYQQTHHQHQQQQQNQGMTLPTNILMQNLGLDQHHHQQSQKQPTNNASNPSAASPLPSHNASSADNMGENEISKQHQQQQHHHDSVTNQFQNQQVGTGDSKQQPPNESDHQASGNASTNDNIISNSVSDNNNINNSDGTQNIPSPSSSAGLGTVADGGAASELNSNNVNSANNATATGADDGQSLNEDSERFSSKANVRIRKTPRTCYLPHQHVNYHVRPLPGIVKRSSLTSGNLLNGPSNESHDLFTNLLKTNFLDSVKSSVPLDQKQQLAAANTHLTQNFVLSDQSSRSIPAIAAAVASRRIVDCSPAGLTAAALTINLSSLGPLYASVRAKDPNSSNRVSRAASPLGNSAENNSASGTSAVAIDNKIEQAMDLVKSHLMFAVREEVEVLKEKINELMDRINQLEVENTILKANASQETLSQLSTATIVVTPQAQVQTSPAQPQSLPALSKINIDASVLQISNMPIQSQPSSNPPPQNPATTS